VSPSNHAVDGSFRRDARIQVGRAVALIVVVVVIAVILLRHNGGGSRPSLAPIATTSTTSPVSTTPSTTVATTVAATTVAPAQVKVVVLNGTTKAGAAGFFKTKLASKGYNVVLATDATASNILDSAVYYQPGYEAEAMTVAADLGIPASAVTALVPTDPVPAAAAASANVIVVVGGNLATQVTS
jgi:LytR cell envelope-related transcriptional attenuator